MNTSDFITSKEGESLLGVTRQMFFYYVKKGKIRKQEGEERGKNLYSREDILKLRADQNKAKQSAPKMIVDWMEPSDLPNILALDMVLYHEEMIGNISTYYNWWKKNNRTTLVAFDAEDRRNVFAQMCLLPVPESTILSVLKGEKNDTDITAEEVESYGKKGEFTLLAESAISLPGHHEYLGEILHKFIEFWCEQWPDRKATRIYAEAVSDEGVYLVKKLYFGPLYDIAENAYVLDLRHKNPSKLITHYQQCIAEKELKILEQNTPTESILIGWMNIERIVTKVMTANGQQPSRSIKENLSQLKSTKLIDQEVYNYLLKLLEIRNKTVHNKSDLQEFDESALYVMKKITSQLEKMGHNSK